MQHSLGLLHKTPVQLYSMQSMRHLLSCEIFLFLFFLFSEVLALEKFQYLFQNLSPEFKYSLSGWKQQTDNLTTGVLYNSVKDMQHHM